MYICGPCGVGVHRHKDAYCLNTWTDSICQCQAARGVTQRYLIVCDGGNVRSNALGFELKWVHNREAIAVGRLYMSEATMAMLSDWATRIVLMQPHMVESIPPQFHDKVVITDVGEDRFGLSVHPELRAMTIEAAKLLVESENEDA